MSGRTDTERLEWLEKQPRTTVISEKNNSRVLFFSPAIGPWDTLKEAIDAAMDGEERG